jgi:hypothetical protein
MGSGIRARPGIGACEPLSAAELMEQRSLVLELRTLFGKQTTLFVQSGSLSVQFASLFLQFGTRKSSSR